eukprot:1161913-Pelagomonas_calceolata.AAC.11
MAQGPWAWRWDDLLRMRWGAWMAMKLFAPVNVRAQECVCSSKQACVSRESAESGTQSVVSAVKRCKSVAVLLGQDKMHDRSMIHKS